MKISFISPLRPLNALCRLRSLRAKDISYGDQPSKLLDIYSSKKINKPLPVIMFWHGGSWQGQDKNGYAFVADYLRSLGAVVVTVKYPLFPDQTFPGFIDDAKEAIDWVAKNIEQHGGDKNKIFLMGHSAGAHTALIATLQDKKKVVKGCISLSAPADVSRRYYGDIFGRSFEKDLQKPTHYIDSYNGNSKFLIVHGARDKIVPYKDAVEIHQALTAKGLTSKLVKLRVGHVRLISFAGRPLGSFYRLGRTIKKFIA